MKNDLIVLDNKLIEAKTDLKSSEALKIFSYAVSMIKKDDKELKEIKIYISDYIATTDKSKKYKQIKNVAVNMSKSIFFIPDGQDFTVCPIFNEIKYKGNEGLLLLEFNTKITPYLLALSSNFTKLYFHNIANLSSFYAIRIYNLLKSKEKFKKVNFDLKNLQEILQCPKSYKTNYQVFKIKVLDISIKEINAKTDIEIYKITTKKTVRKITSIKIYFRDRNELNLTNLQAFIKSIKNKMEGKELFKPRDLNIKSFDNLTVLKDTILSIKNGLLKTNTEKEHLSKEESLYYFKAFYKIKLAENNKYKNIGNSLNEDYLKKLESKLINE